MLFKFPLNALGAAHPNFPSSGEQCIDFQKVAYKKQQNSSCGGREETVKKKKKEEEEIPQEKEIVETETKWKIPTLRIPK